MVILTRIYIIACLLLNFLMCQRQEYPEEYSSNYLGEQNPETAMPKHPGSGELEALPNFDQWRPNPVRDTHSEIEICPAEHPSDVSFEKSAAHRENPKKIVKDEDDDDDLDVAAGDDDDEDDDDGLNVDDEAFVARIACLMGALDHHAKVITGNVKNIESRLGKLRPQGTSRKANRGKEQHPKVKWSKKSQYFQDLQECPGPLGYPQASRDVSEEVSGQKLDPNTPAELPSQNRAGTSLSGSETKRWLPRQDAFGSMNPSPEAPEQSHQRFAEYEAKLTRLMANRDAIERNVMKMLGPRQAERL